MKKICFGIMLVLFTFTINSQNKSWDNIPDDIKEKKAYKRWEWFYKQRENPDGSLPVEEYFRTQTAEMEKEAFRLANTPGKSTGWRLIGPTGIVSTFPSQWGIVSGRGRGVAVHPTNPNIVYLGAASGGIWKSTDGGGTWQDVGRDLASLTFGAIEIDSANPNIVYAGSGEAMFNFNKVIYDGKGVYKSTNAGATWSNITSGIGNRTHTGAVKVNPFNSDIVIAALGSGYWHQMTPGNEGIWRSTNAGADWTRVINADDGFDVLFHPTTSGRVYSAVGGGSSSNSGFYISTDHGATWARSNTGLPSPSYISRIQIALSSSKPSTIYALVYTRYTPEKTMRLYKSTDNGANWTAQSPSYTNSQGWYDLLLGVNPSNADEVYIGDAELRKSTDGGTTFSQVGGTYWNQSMHVDFHNMVYSRSDPNIRYVVCDGGIYRSGDAGATWVNKNTGLPTLQYYKISSHPTNKNIIIGGAQDNGLFRTTTGSTGTWDLISTGDGMESFFDYANPNNVFISTQNGGLARSTTGGGYDSFTPIAPAWVGPVAWTVPFFQHPSTSTKLYTASNRPYISTNSGTDWTALSGAVTTGQIVTMEMSSVDTNNMILSGGGDYTNTPTVHVSTNGGTAWTEVTTNIAGVERYISKVAFHPTNGNTVYVVRSGFSPGNKIYRSTNLGATWTNLSGDLPDVPHSDLFIDPLAPTIMYTCNDLGVYKTTNSGANWIRESGIPFVPAIDFSYFNSGSDRLLRVGTHGRSAYEIQLTTSSITVTAPNGGETWDGGTNRYITWNSTGIANVKLEYSTDDGINWIEISPSAPAAAGSYLWAIPSILSAYCRVKVSDASNSATSDVSDAVFAILYNPIPAVVSSSSSSATAGGPAFLLTVYGSNFVGGSVVRWNGSDRATTYYGSTELDAEILASDIASGGTATLTVFNPAPGGGTSNGLTFTINNPAPSTSSLSPYNATAGGFGFTLIVNGSNFVNGSVVTWNGENRATTFVNSTRVDADISAGDIASGGNATVRVVNGTPGGGTSPGLTFTINNPSPSVVSLTPSSVAAGSGAFTLTVYGVDFVPSSVVRFNTSDKPTTYISPTQLNASISAQDISEAEYYPILVINPQPGGGVSNAVTLTVTNPVPALDSISPANVIAGGDGFTMTLHGTNFVSSSAVRINGFYRTTTFISSTQLQAAITAGDRAAAGYSDITVFNPVPGGGESGTLTLTVNNPAPYIASISPTPVIAGGDAFTLTVTGSNFMANSVVRFNALNRATTFINGSELQAVITANDRATGVAASITVNTPAPGGGVSNEQILNVNNPTPYISYLTPSSVIAGGSEFTLTLTGQYFVPGSIVRVNGENRTTNYVGSTEIEAVITAEDRANGGTDTITVFNPSPAGGLSNVGILTINNPQPYIGSLSPAKVTAGNPEFTLTVNGANYVSGSIVRWNGTSRPTTYVSGSRLTAVISADDIVVSGSALITVWSPAPGGGPSVEYALTISAGPAQQAALATVTGIGENQVNINWTDGNGEKRVVFMKQGAGGTPELVNDSSYTANTSFGAGSQIGGGWSCVFNGTVHAGGTLITGLQSGRYSFMVCEYNGNAGQEVYNLNPTTGNPKTFIAKAQLAYPGNALDLDGADDYVKCGNAASLNITGTNITLETWVKARSWKNNAADGGLIVKEGTNTGYVLRCGDNGKVNFGFGDGSAWRELTTNPVLTLNTWHHIAVVYNGSTIKIYVDGEGTSALPATESIAGNTENLWLASSAVHPERSFDGQIDEVRIWNSARSRSDILASMYSALTGGESGLAAYYDFDNGTPSGNNAGKEDLFDMTSNANDGTLKNLALAGHSSNWIASAAGPPITVNLKLFIEGFYDTTSGAHNAIDTISAALKSVSGSFETHDSLRAELLQNGSAILKFGGAPGGLYYLTVRHRNSIETWSKNGGETFAKGTTTDYDFTTAQTRAYADNLKLKGTVWCIFSGDVNQDGIVDFSDLALIDNDSYNFLSGHVPTDITGDDFVDFSDLMIADNNNFNFVSVVSPLTGNRHTRGKVNAGSIDETFPKKKESSYKNRVRPEMNFLPMLPDRRTLNRKENTPE